MTMSSLIKSGTSFQDKLAKQNEMSRKMLVRELSKLEESQRSDGRMMETAKQRFRSRYKKLGVRVASSGSEAINIRMYETHNPGFCYHCNGEIKESGPGSFKNASEAFPDSYEVVRAMLLTDGEVDVDKILCLHLLAAHTTSGNAQRENSDLETSFFEKASKNREKPLTGAWNNLLPCYVLELQRDEFPDDPKLREDIRKASQENETLRNFQLSYERYANENADIVSALTAHDRLARMAPRILGKMPIISPHVYSLLGASHELRVKQAIAEGNKRYNKRSSLVDVEFHDTGSIADSFQLLENDDNERASRINPNVSARDVSRAGFSKIHETTKSHSRRSVIGSIVKLDRSITMLKGKPRKSAEEFMKKWRTNESSGIKIPTNDLVAIKPSYRNLVGPTSKNPSARSIFPTNYQSFSINSMDSFVFGSSKYPTRKYRKCVYLNSPVKSFALKTREYRNAPIFVNYQIQALVHSVLDVLERMNPEKFRRIVETAGNVEKISEIFQRPEVQRFVESLVGEPLISSPESFVISAATAIEEIDARLESLVENELIATTLEIPASPGLEMLVDEIRENIFFDGKKISEESIDESSKTVHLPIANKSEESARLFDEIQKKETPQDLESPVKYKTKRIAAAIKSSEGIKVADEFVKLEGRVVSSGGKNRQKIINDLTGTEIGNDTSSLNIMKYKEKTQFKPQKITQDTGYSNPDRVILRRMTNAQRILVGRVCAALKTKRINNEGLIRERTPLAALITPVLSRESIKMLTRGTTYCKSSVIKKLEEEDEKEEQTVARSDKLTGPVLAKVRRDIAEHETKRRLEAFFAM